MLGRASLTVSLFPLPGIRQAHVLIEELTAQVAEHQQAMRELQSRLDAKEAAHEEDILESLAARMLPVTAYRLASKTGASGKPACCFTKMPWAWMAGRPEQLCCCVAFRTD
jgi:hypothetical protein